MDRPTKEITTTGGHVIVLREFITGREQRDIQQVFLQHVQLGKIAAGEPSLSGFDAKAVAEAQDKAITYVVVSADGATENVVDAVLNLPAQDAKEVLDAIEEVTADKKK